MRQETKETPINIRAKASQRDIIDRAAQLLSKSRTDFVLEAACREAQDVLLDQRLFITDEHQFNAFIQAMETPVENHEKLNALMNRKSPWE